MPYRDQEKQKEANRENKRKQREGMTSGMTKKEGMTLSNGIYIDKDKAIRLAKIHNSLNHRIAGLSGGESMLDMVRYGGITMREVGRMIVEGEILKG